jgi:hypothetical protein
MKKLFFTAVALVGFSLASVANSFTFNGKESLTIKNTQELYAKNCAWLRSATLKYGLEQGFPYSQANDIATAVFEKCIGC